MKPTSWSYRYVELSLVLIALCFPAIWYFSGYGEQSFNEMLSYLVDDGTCVKGVQSVGRHCFGDYAIWDTVLRSDDIWNPDLFNNSYPPFSLVPIIAFLQIGRLTGSWSLGRNLYLLLLAVSLLSPALWVARRRWAERGAVTFLIIGVASVPFLVTLDRGNTSGLLVAPLLGLALSYMNERHGRMVFFIVICALLKPHMLLFALLLLVYRRYSWFFCAVAASVALTLAGFLFFPGSFSENVTNWVYSIRGYNDYAGLSSPWPSNLGIGRSVLTLFDLSHLEWFTGEATRTDLASWLSLHSSLLAVFLIAVTTAMIFLRARDSNPLYPLLAVCVLVAIAPGTSWMYYIWLLLVPAAFVLRDPLSDGQAQGQETLWSGMLDRGNANDTLWDRCSRRLLILGLALLMAPLVVPVTAVPLLDAHTTVSVGLLQVLWGPLLLGLFFLVIAMALLPLRPIAFRGRRVKTGDACHLTTDPPLKEGSSDAVDQGCAAPTSM